MEAGYGQTGEEVINLGGRVKGQEEESEMRVGSAGKSWHTAQQGYLSRFRV